MRFTFGMGFDDEVMVGAVKWVKRYLITPMGGYFPVLAKLSNGDLAVVLRMGDYHIGQRGRIEMATSRDGGRTWTAPRLAISSQTDDRNPAFCQLRDDTLLLAFGRLSGYENGRLSRDKMNFQIFLTRSRDMGETWSKPEPLEVGDASVKLGPICSPYGKMLQLKDGTVFLAVYQEELPRRGDRNYSSYLLHSEDEGYTWRDATLIAQGYNETALLQLPDGNLLAALRGPHVQGGGECVAISHSKDLGYTWSEPRQLTIGGEHPGDLCYLKSGKVLLTFGHRRVPYGVHTVISPDGGQSWMFNRRIALASYATNTDCGYPSSVQLEDGTIYTAYYATTCLTFNEFGSHAAGVAYQEEIFSE